MRHLSSRLAFAVMIVLVVTGSLLAFMVTRSLAQGEIVSNLTNRLTQQGVPIKAIVVRSQAPLSLEITLQSSSGTLAPARDDGFYLLDVRREVMRAESRGYRVDSYKVTLLNKQGTAIHSEESVLTSLAVPRNLRPATVSDSAAERLVVERLELHGMSLDDVSVQSDAEGLQTLVLRLSVADLQTANNALPKFMPSLYPFLGGMNAETGSQITVCWVILVNGNGETLLKYVLDLTLEAERWWMGDGVTQDWFPHPPSVEDVSP